MIFHQYPPLFKHYRKTTELPNIMAELVKDWPCLTERMQTLFMKWEISFSVLESLAGCWIYNLEVSASFQLRGIKWLWLRCETW